MKTKSVKRPPAAWPPITDTMAAMRLLEMEWADQTMRERNLADPQFWDPSVDAANCEGMKKIIALIGWPTVSKVGTVASHAAALIVRHADHDVSFQKVCLNMMKAAAAGETDRSDIAHLEDRICVNEGRPQIYGTQFTQTATGRHVPRPIRDPDNVDKRRKVMGLSSLKSAITGMYRKYPMSKKNKKNS